MAEAIVKQLGLWPKTLNNTIGHTHTAIDGTGTIELTAVTNRLVLTGATVDEMIKPIDLAGNLPASGGVKFSLTQNMFLVLNNGVDPIEMRKIQWAGGNAIQLEGSALSNAYGAGSTFTIIDPLGYWPDRGYTIKNVDVANATYTNGYGISRAIYPNETISLGSPWTVTEPVLIDATGTIVVIDEVAR